MPVRVVGPRLFRALIPNLRFLFHHLTRATLENIFPKMLGYPSATEIIETVCRGIFANNATSAGMGNPKRSLAAAFPALHPGFGAKAENLIRLNHVGHYPVLAALNEVTIHQARPIS